MLHTHLVEQGVLTFEQFDVENGLDDLRTHDRMLTIRLNPLEHLVPALGHEFDSGESLLTRELLILACMCFDDRVQLALELRLRLLV